MNQPNYLKIVRWSDEDNCYVGSIPDLCGDCCHADTQLETYQHLIEIEADWIEIYKKDGKPLPEIKTRPMREIA